MDIYPSILSQSSDEIIHYIEQFSDVFAHFQIDIADGKFVSNTTVSLEHLSEVVLKNPPTIPMGTTFEFHLMVEDFASEMRHLETINIHLPIKTVLLHFQPAIRWASHRDEALHEALHDDFPFSFGLSLNPEVDILPHIDVLQSFETIQIMTVHPGGQGRPFIPDMLDKIMDLRMFGYNGRIILDGGINNSTLPLILEKKDWPDAVCPGSYLGSHTIDHLEELQKLLIEAS